MTEDGKIEMIGDYQTIPTRFHKNEEYRQLRKLIKKSWKVPEKYRNRTINNLIKEEITVTFLGDKRKYKYLFATAMFYRSYDIFTTSLLTFLFSNRVSVHILLRAQLENLCLISYYIENKEKIKDSFNEIIGVKDGRKCLENDFPDGLISEMYRWLSKRTHPFPDGLKTYFGAVSTMYFGNDGTPLYIPELNVKPHHETDDELGREYAISAINDSFESVIGRLHEIINLDIDDKIENYSELQRKGEYANI